MGLDEALAQLEPEFGEDDGIGYITPQDLADAFNALHNATIDLGVGKEDRLPVNGAPGDVLTWSGAVWGPAAPTGGGGGGGSLVRVEGVLAGTVPMPANPAPMSGWLIGAPVPASVATVLPLTKVGDLIVWDGTGWANLGAVGGVSQPSLAFAVGDGTNGALGQLYYTMIVPTPPFVGRPPAGWTDVGNVTGTGLASHIFGGLPPDWVDQPYGHGSLVSHVENVWWSNAAVVRGEEPGVSPKWVQVDLAWMLAGINANLEKPGRYATDVTLTANTWATVSHSLGTTDVVVSVRSGTVVVSAAVEVVDATSIRVQASTAGTYRVVVIG